MKPLPILLGLGVVSAVLLASKKALASDGSGPWALGSGWPGLDSDVDSTDNEPVEMPSVPSSMRPRSYIDAAERDRRFGPIAWYPSPTSSNPEAITITNDFENRLVRKTFPGLPGSPTIRIHELAARPLELVLMDLENAGELDLIRTFEGVWNPRLVRGGSTLSSHAYGTSIDLNARENPLGAPATIDQRRLAEYFEGRGWYWGERFSRPDPMHFEWIGA